MEDNKKRISLKSTILSLVIIVLLAGNVYQYFHFTNMANLEEVEKSNKVTIQEIIGKYSFQSGESRYRIEFMQSDGINKDSLKIYKGKSGGEMSQIRAIPIIVNVEKNEKGKLYISKKMEFELFNYIAYSMYIDEAESKLSKTVDTSKSPIKTGELLNTDTKIDMELNSDFYKKIKYSFNKIDDNTYRIDIDGRE